MKYNEKLISIIIPVYNVEKYLLDCLASLDRQNFTDDVEILLLDDGSTDDSLSLCKKKANQDNRYYVYHHDNRGVAYTRNRGLQLAKGRYIAWIDPDDYIVDDWYASIKKCLEKKCDLIFFDYYIYKENKSKMIFYDKYSRMISREELFCELAIGDKMQSHLVTKIMPKSYYFGEKTFNNKLSYCEDYEAMVRIMEKAEKIFYFHKPLYVYRQREGSIVNANNEKILSNRWISIKFTKDRYEYIKSMGVAIQNLGYMIACFKFCYCYQILGIRNDLWRGRYRFVMKKLRKNFIPLLLNSRFSCRKKLILILVLLGVGGKIYNFKLNLKDNVTI